MNWSDLQRHTGVGNFIYPVAETEIFAVNLQDVNKDLKILRDGLEKIHKELLEYFTDPEANDMYGSQMWGFYKKARSKLDDLIDNVQNAETTFLDVTRYYGEDDKNMTSSEFYGIFKTFVTSYKVGLSLVQSERMLMTRIEM